MSQRGNRLMHQPEQQEERSLWQKVVNELKALMAHEAKVNDIRRKIDTLEERNRRHDATSADLQELATCYKGLKALTDEESRLLSHVIEHNLSILIGLRKATEQGYGSSGTGRDGFSKRKRNEAVSVDNSASRGKPRSMSVPNENGPVLQVGSQVAFRLPKQKGAEDPEPDELGNHGQQIYKAVAHQLIQIPSDSAGLLPYPNGKQVLARYPETTTFYKAEVIGTKIGVIYNIISGSGPKRPIISRPTEIASQPPEIQLNLDSRHEVIVADFHASFICGIEITGSHGRVV
ncbi:SAGA HAT/Core module component [Orbilia oligospora]|uniref:SAGA HAT/Core module component n=1 Tax=Orbilia oligospora TaxID=2813651 RepID=A0A7C8Q7T8_ORBOL|nr:SAGA HAT/Core module component [Orbilia oligospora]